MTQDIQMAMTGVVVLTTQLNDADTSVDHKMLAETVLVSGEGMVSMLADILDIAGVEAGRHALESIAFDLRSLVQDVTDLLRVPAHREGLELTCRFPDDLPATFRGDPGRLRRVVTDLVSNALKFTPTGEVLLELFQEDCAEDNVMIRFEVVGVGFGITRAQRPAFFESFSQGDVDTIRSYGAAGLGLAMSHQLVELMGGKVGVRNNLGHASTFWFSLPLERTRSATEERAPGSVVDHAESTASASPPGEPSAGTSDTGVSGGEGSRGRVSGQILLAEDNPVNQRVAAVMLQNLGFHVDVVADGAQAVRAAAENSYSAILMDGQMPILDGYRATGEIRLHEGPDRTPIIAVTGSTMKADQQRCLAAGMDDYLAKPFKVNALAEVLRRWVSDGPDPAYGSDPTEASPPIHAGLDHLNDPTRPVLDVEVVARLQQLGEAAGEDLMGQLATLFLSDADSRLAALRQALGRDDAAAVVRSAHTLSGASANLGATALARLCATLAADGAVGDLMGGEALLDALEEELGRVRAALGSSVALPC